MYLPKGYLSPKTLLTVCTVCKYQLTCLSSTFIGTLDTKLDNHTDFIVLVDDIWKATLKIQQNVGGINETQQIMKGKSYTFELFKLNRLVTKDQIIKTKYVSANIYFCHYNLKRK